MLQHAESTLDTVDWSVVATKVTTLWMINWQSKVAH